MYQKFYFFNLTNAENVTIGEKPIVQELGPYCYRRYEINFNVSFPEGGNYREYETLVNFVYDYNCSNGNDPDVDIITTANIPFKAVQANIGKKKIEKKKERKT